MTKRSSEEIKKLTSRVKNMEDWLNRHKGLLEFFMVFLTFLMVIATFFQGYISSQQVKESRRAIDLQYTPQINIEVNSARIPTISDETSYAKANFFDVYKNDLIKTQDNFGKISITSEVTIPINITFYNLGSIGTKLERIRYNFECDAKGEKDWQVDILNNRVIAPQTELKYSNQLFLDLGQIPTTNKKCQLLFKFFFYNGYKEEIRYYVRYHNYSLSINQK